MSKLGLPSLTHGFGRVDLGPAGDEGAERRDAVGVGGHELDVPRPGAGAAAPARAGVDAVPGGEDESAGSGC